jgi:hypothetical protein
MDGGINESYIEEETIPKMGYFTRLTSIFVSPVKLMQNIKYHTSILPMLITGMALSLINIPFQGKITEMANDKLAEIALTRYGQEFANFMQSAQSAASTQMVTSVATIITLLLTTLVTCILQALILLIITKIVKGGANFGQYVSMYSHVLIITMIGSVFASVVMTSMGTLLDISSLAAVFMPNGDFSIPMYNILSSITLFGILQSVLVFMGVREINEFSGVKACVITLIMFILGVAFTAVMASLSTLSLDITYRAMGF